MGAFRGDARERQKLRIWSPVELGEARQVAGSLGLSLLISKMEDREGHMKGVWGSAEVMYSVRSKRY